MYFPQRFKPNEVEEKQIPVVNEAKNLRSSAFCKLLIFLCWVVCCAVGMIVDKTYESKIAAMRKKSDVKIFLQSIVIGCNCCVTTCGSQDYVNFSPEYNRDPPPSYRRDQPPPPSLTRAITPTDKNIFIIKLKINTVRKYCHVVVYYDRFFVLLYCTALWMKNSISSASLSDIKS